MAFIRIVVIFILTTYDCVTGLQVNYSSQPFRDSIPIFDAKIGCDVAKLAWDYANILQPQQNLISVFDALELHKCNVTNHRKVQETK